MATTETVIPTWTLQDRIVKARHFAGYTQGELSARSGIPFKTLQRLERGEKEPAEATLIGLAMICGVDPNWLLTGEVTSTVLGGLTHEELPLIAA